MQPLYDPGTLLVVEKKSFDELTRGQTVIYQSERGRSVAHLLVAKCRNGWRVAGLNNRIHDWDGVTAENLTGVVVAAIAPIPDNGSALNHDPRVIRSMGKIARRSDTPSTYFSTEHSKDSSK